MYNIKKKDDSWYFSDVSMKALSLLNLNLLKRQ